MQSWWWSHQTSTLLELLPCFQSGQWWRPNGDKRPQPETVSAGESRGGVATGLSPLFNAQWLHPCLCITSHWCQGLSRKKSVIKSPSKEHWVCTHLQYLHTSTDKHQPTRMLPELGRDNHFWLIWVWTDPVLSIWPSEAPVPLRSKNKIISPIRWQIHGTRPKLEERVIRHSHC